MQRHPLLQLQTWGLMLPTHCSKRLLQLDIYRGDANGSTLPTTNKMHVLLIFNCLQVERATRQRRPLLQLQTRGLMLPAHCWKHSLRHSKYTSDANVSGLCTTNKYLFANPLLFESGEGDGTTSPSFPAKNVGIDASSALLEALIAT